MLWGEVPTSIPEIILSANWVFEGKYLQKWRRIKNNKVFWVLCSLFFLHLIGLFHTHDIKNGLADIGVKVPLLLLPFLFFTTEPLTRSELKGLMYTVIAGVVSSSLWCLIYSYTHTMADTRTASRFISHIRFGLMINMGICILVYLMMKETRNVNRIFITLIIAYLLFFMIKISLITGLVLFGILTIAFSIFNIIRQPAKIKMISLLVLVAITLTGILFLKQEWDAFRYVDASAANRVKMKSASGREYYKASKKLHTENGFYIECNIQYQELDYGWYKRSKKHIYSVDEKGNTMMWVLVRYLASKGLTKDSAGMAMLSNQDIVNVEHGITNYKYADASALRNRVKEFFWEYRDYKEGSNPSGNTLLMRFEFWKAAVYIIERNPVFGVGTGDAKRAFNKAYFRTETKLSYDWRLRSHNQFLAITVAFGLTGLLVFIFYLFYPLLKLKNKLNPLYYMFFIIAIVSFLTEDTLETQAGDTFFAYYNSLFLWLASSDKEKSREEI